jgi:hypothetical protein
MGFQSTVAGYPGPETLSTPQANLRNGLEGYPGSIQDEIIRLPDAYPGLSEAVRSSRDVMQQNGGSTTGGATAIGQGSAAGADLEQTQSEQEPASTIMLWIGFLASLVIFVAAVIGAAYFYRRQSSK